MAECYSDIEWSAPWKSTPIAAACSSSGSGTKSSQDSPSGMMSGHSTAVPGVESLTSFAADSHARTFQARVCELESMAKNLDFGATCSESFVRFDRDSRSWKTHQCFFDAVLPESSVTLPAMGMMRAGVLLVAASSALHMTGRECGCWLGTPTATMTVRSLDWRLGNLPSPRELCGGLTPHPEWVEWLMGWPIGWSGIEPLGVDKFRPWWRSFGGCSAGLDFPATL